MIYFGIPLRAKETCNDWGRVCDLFRKTISSICAQTDDEYEIIVACHDIPELEERYLGKVTFVKSSSPIPVTSVEMMHDKGWKKHLIGMEIRKRGGGYIMLVDADDLISNRIAAWCKAHPSSNGFVSKYGYVRYGNSKNLILVKNMHKLCGSCIIVHCDEQQLPDSLPKSFDDIAEDAEKYIIRCQHNLVVDRMAAQNRPLDYIPFPTTIYNRSTGENHSQVLGAGIALYKIAKKAVKWHRKINDKIIEEFFGVADENGGSVCAEKTVKSQTTQK